jgi:prevent-host-death family protein
MTIMAIKPIVSFPREQAMAAKIWTVAEAKSTLGELIDLARSRGQQTIARNGRTAVVVAAAEEWERKIKRTVILRSSLLHRHSGDRS